MNTSSGFRTKTRARHPSMWLWLLRLYVALVLIFLIAPILVVFPLSFSASTYLQFPPPALSLQWYWRFLGDPVWIGALLTSLKVGFGTTVLATVLGTLLSFSLVRGRYPGRRFVEIVTMTPIIVPNMVIAIAVYGIFADLQLVGGWYGVVLGHTIYAIPFVILVVAPTLRGFDESQELAAMGMGASRLKAIWHITLPQMRPALVSAAFLAFITSFDELVIALFLSGAQPTLPKKMFEAIVFEIDPTIAAISVLQILMVALIIAIASRFGVGTGIAR